MAGQDIRKKILAEHARAQKAASSPYQYGTKAAAVGATGVGTEIGREFASAAYGRGMAEYEKQMEDFRNKMRRMSITRSAVQRRAFFEEPQQQMAAGMRSTTGAA